MSNKPAAWGAIFDWDGVVIDSSTHHEESWERLARENEKLLPEGHFKKGFGMKNEAIIPGILNWSNEPAEVARLSLRKEALYREVVAERGVTALSGVREWLARLRAAGVPCVIGSSTHRKNIELTLGQIGLAEFFAGIVSAENVSHGKPHPEVFLNAAETIHRSPSVCVVFEDALVGIEAARNAGMRVVAVATTNKADALQAADRVVERLDELDISDLERWWE